MYIYLFHQHICYIPKPKGSSVACAMESNKESCGSKQHWVNPKQSWLKLPFSHLLAFLLTPFSAKVSLLCIEQTPHTPFLSGPILDPL